MYADSGPILATIPSRFTENFPRFLRNIRSRKARREKTRPAMLPAA